MMIAFLEGRYVFFNVFKALFVYPFVRLINVQYLEM